MSDPLFQPDDHDRAILARGWVIVAAIVTQLAALASACPTGAARNGALRVLRVGEGLVRRLLLVQALMKPLPPVYAFTAAAGRRIAQAVRRRQWHPQDVRYRPPAVRPPGFRLAETLITTPSGDAQGRARAAPPAVTVVRHGILTVTTYSTAGNQTLKYVEGRGICMIDPDCTPPRLDPLASRFAALKTVAKAPGRHVRRMARWIARQRMRRHGRLSPLRLGRPPGSCLAQAWRDEQMSLLFDMSYVARRAVAAAPRRRHSRDNQTV